MKENYIACFSYSSGDKRNGTEIDGRARFGMLLLNPTTSPNPYLETKLINKRISQIIILKKPLKDKNP